MMKQEIDALYAENLEIRLDRAVLRDRNEVLTLRLSIMRTTVWISTFAGIGFGLAIGWLTGSL